MRERKFKHCLTSKEIQDLLKRSGIQPTAQRIAVSRYALCEMEHATVEQIKEWADDNFPKISLATVYNTVNTLVESGILKALKLPHSDKVIYDNNVDKHYHFLDEETGELIDIFPEDIEISHNLDKELNINGIDLIFTGTKKGK